MSRVYLGQYMREVLGASYRLIKAIMPIHNEFRCKLQRQFAARFFIEALHSGKTIINIDEAVIQHTEHRKRGWLMRGRLNQVIHTKRMTGVNLIAAFTNTGEFLCTVNCGNTNNNTFGYFLIRLSEHLDKRTVDWRRNSVLMMDNAVFHRAPQTK